VHLDDDNNFFHFDYYTEANACLELAKNLDKKPRKSIISHIQITRPSEGVKPTLSKITATKKGATSANVPPQKPGIKSDEPQQEPEVEEKEQTFFQKYWYVFAAITILAFISGGSGGAPATAPTGVAAR